MTKIALHFILYHLLPVLQKALTEGRQERP